MKGILLIGSDKIGEVTFSIIDESMGAIGGELTAYDNYQKYKPAIQLHCDKRGISNVDDFDYRILLASDFELKPEGGIGVTDLSGFDQIYVEVGGVDHAIINKIKNAL